MKETIAVVGIGCRFPGGIESPGDYWNYLQSAGQACSDVPPDRWQWERYYDPNPNVPGKMWVKRAHFLSEHSVYDMDARFFGISPREAELLDPQQRLLLEVAWETFEDAYVPVAGSRDEKVGVFVGGFTLDNFIMRGGDRGMSEVTPQTVLGSPMTLLSNRLSYQYGFRGPSMTIDTACSSSLVATHLACQSLLNDECRMALAGGVNVILNPTTSVIMSKGRFLSKDGCSKAFFESADGYGRGEGAGLVLLKRLSDAIADGDRIHGVILGSSVNQDGRTDGMPMPNPDAQQALIRDTCERAGVRLSDIDYVEAHGTGTQAGDRAETGAIGATYGGQRSEPLPVGSAKTNIGHLEGAAGIAGLIKAVLSVKKRSVLPHVKFGALNPNIDFDRLGIGIPLADDTWYGNLEPRTAAVNSFGFGGTNAHAVVQRYEPGEGAGSGASNGASRRGKQFFTLSASDADALDSAARAVTGVAAQPETSVASLSAALARGRSHLPHRLAFFAETPAEVGREVEHYLNRDGAFTGKTARATEANGLVWVFSGMGPQTWTMGQELLAKSEVFAAAWNEIDERFRSLCDWSLPDALANGDHSSRLVPNNIAQCANFAVQIGVSRVLQDWGLPSAAIVGHSVGEVAAAVVAGSLSLDDGVKLIYHRGALSQRIADRGRLLAIGCGASHPLVVSALEVDGLSVAAFNAPDSVAIAGPEALLADLQARLDDKGVFNRLVMGQVPYHSPWMDPIESDFLASIAAIAPQSPTVPLCSTVTGTWLDEPQDARYWWRNMRQPVQFGKAVQSLIGRGHHHFIQVGPHPVLGAALHSGLKAAGAEGAVLGTLDRKRSEVECLQNAIASAYVAGVDLQFEKTSPGNRCDAPLPTYPWNRQRIWFEGSAQSAVLEARGPDHPMAQQRVDAPDTTLAVELERSNFGYLRDHRVDGEAIVPGAAYIEAGLVAYFSHYERQTCVLRDLAFESPLGLPSDENPVMFVSSPRAGDDFAVHTQAGEGNWRRHARGTFVKDAVYKPGPARDLSALKAGATQCVEGSEFYAKLAARGYDYGPFFQTVAKAWLTETTVVARLDHRLRRSSDRSQYVHPAILDGALQSLVALPCAGERTMIPVGVDEIRYFKRAFDEVWMVGRVVHQDDRGLTADLELLSDDGDVCIELRGVRCRDLGVRESVGSAAETWVYASSYEPVGELEAAATDDLSGQRWLFLSEPDSGARSLAELATARGASASTCHIAETDAALELIAKEKPPTVVVACRAVYNDETTGAQAVGEHRLVAISEFVRRLPVDSGVNRLVLSIQDDTGLQAAALAGMFRTLGTERSHLRPRLVTAASDLEPAELLLALGDHDRGEELRYDGGWTRRRIVHQPVRNQRARDARFKASASDTPMQLRVDYQGSLDGLVLAQSEPAALGANEVQLRVEVAALNFKDVMKPLGLLAKEDTDDTWIGTELGLEGVGVVSAVGSEVSDLATGDRVVFFGPGLRSHLSIDASYCVRLPDEVSSEEAATLFVGVTARHALVEVGAIQAGQRCLVHSAAGGVGMSAVRLAQRAGARVIATAGTDEKRELLRKMGVEHVFDSRSLNFLSELDALGEDGKLDLVLAASTPSMVRGLLERIRPGGRYLEIGKTALRDGQHLSMSSFAHSVSYCAIDLDKISRNSSDVWRRNMLQLLRDASAGIRLELPTEVFGIDRHRDAFKRFATGQVIGKVLLDWRGGQCDVAPRIADTLQLAADRTYLVTGGTSGFGLRTAQWLARQGARNLVLASRSGRVKDAEQPAIAEIETLGASVRCISLDVGDLDSVRDCIERLAAGDKPLAGVVHSAAVLEDRVLDRLDEASWRKVLGPKAYGAWNLWRALDDSAANLDFAILYSSVVGTTGNPGQTSYAAANTFLDGLADYMTARGTPCTSLAWGSIGEVGMVARDDSVARHLAAIGVHPVPPDLGLDMMGRLVAERHTAVGIFNFDWDLWAQSVPGTKRRVQNLLSDSADNDGFAGDVRRLPEDERLGFVLNALGTIVGDVRGDADETLPADVPLNQVGFDSLMAVELALRVQRELGVEMSSMELLAGRGMGQLSQKILEKLETEAPEHGAGAESEGPQALVAADDGDWSEFFLQRIKVQRPYFHLDEIRRDRNTFRAWVSPDEAGGSDRISIAEIARHLALLGSCAVSASNPSDQRHCYPVKTAVLEHLQPRSSDAWSSHRYALQAEGTSFDLAGGTGGATMTISNSDGVALATLDVEYFVIPNEAFEQMMGEHRVPGFTGAESNVYANLDTTFDSVESRGDALVGVLNEVRSDICAGHFPDFPAFPVSIMTRYAESLLAQLAETLGDKRAPEFRRGTGFANQFVFPGSRVEFVATRDSEGAAGADKGSDRSWSVDIIVNGDVVAGFSFWT